MSEPHNAPTSAAAYAEIKERKLMDGWYLKIFGDLLEHPGGTQNEIFFRVRDASEKGVLGHSISPRFAELVRWGVLKIEGERRCAITGRKAKTYVLTGNLPERKTVRSPSRLKLAQQEIAELKRKLAQATAVDPPSIVADHLARLGLGDPEPPAAWRAWVVGQYAKSPNASGWRVLVSTIFAREFSKMPITLEDLLEVARAGLRNNSPSVHALTGLSFEDIASIDAWLDKTLAAVPPPTSAGT